MSDPRFARLKSDPRFRRPKTKSTKVVIDERFKGVFAKDKKKNGKPLRRKVDKYGRPISDTQNQENLRRYYRLEDEEEGEDVPRKPDLARGEVLLESSDEEEDDAGKDSESESDDFVTLGGDSSRPIAVNDDDDAEIDLDEENFADLDAQAASYSNVHQDEDEAQPDATRTARLAVVNLDWDHVRASHLYKICASLVSLTAPVVRASMSSLSEPTSGRRKSGHGDTGQINVVRGKVLSVRVFPSDFGKKRMEREEKEGPPPEIFKKKQDLDIDEVNERTIYEVGGEEDYDEDALRKYQLERLRYYYAVVTCDTVDAASHIYNELEGTELERSANVFDMSFVPDDMTFENEPRDEATDDVNTNYKAVEFVTDALRHSKVKLTWDDDDPERNHVTRRALTRKEIEESDFKAYLANSSSEEEEEDKAPKKKDKKASRDKLRSLLLGGNDDAMPEGWGDEDGANEDIDMEITFTPGLSKKEQKDETTLEKYQRKMKDKRKKRKDEVKEVAKDKKLDDDFFEAGSDDEQKEGDEQQKHLGKTKKGQKKEENDQDPPTRSEATAEELALLTASDNPNTEPKHFNLKSVIKAEKHKKRRKGKKGKTEDDNEAQEDFVVDVKDERFKVLFEDHQFAIDPTNPHFKKTKAMSALLDERQKRQRDLRGGQEIDVAGRPKGVKDAGESLQRLVESVKRKSANNDPPGQGKRRKL
ncbi:hypothetical protein GALMADRAFT_107424 [Galerina marginata CBS 339.88]|uniref:Uncharacterized protein n=1 Tax=Galerina marginata (strain CBS 339.88) TaxID=685588 RepID=A0A067TP54_GALM3|nr:hypothetical protein GALMADRAFT_107424 [Galerina marginata CBS 339.88]